MGWGSLQENVEGAYEHLNFFNLQLGRMEQQFAVYEERSPDL